jgi:2-oxoisovalerate dehydrogenase E1 component
MKASASRNQSPAVRVSSPSSTRTAAELSADDLRHAYRVMLLSRRLDDKEIQLKNQSHIFFQISGAGHEAVLMAAGMTFRGGYDWFVPYYRDRALCLALGVTPLDMLLQAVGARDDPASHGRQMPSHWSSRSLHIVSGGSPTGTQCLQAVGVAEAGLLYQQIDTIADREEHFHADEVVFCSLGEGATSEGEFWESLNTASQKRLSVVYLVEDNGYAISVPVDAQTPGGDISRLVEPFPHLKVVRVDGCDFLASHNALHEAVQWARDRQGPALVHAKVTRPYSH